jgi:3-methyladenine DNA glycosylase/8-oxoguanine DNA glycosylase
LSAPPRPPDDERPLVTLDLRSRWPITLPKLIGKDGITRRRPGGIERLLHVGDERVVVRASAPATDRVVIRAWADDRAAAEEAGDRMRFALGVDDDLRPFHDRFRDDPLIGRSVRTNLALRVPRRPQPFEALVWAVCEQLIEYDRAAAIQRRMVWRFGRRCNRTGLRDAPTPAAMAALAPAQLAALDLAASRATALIRAAREVASGRVDLDAPDHERGWARLRAIRGIGPWTVEILALHGQGRLDQVPAGDLGYRKIVGRLRAGGNPRAPIADEDEVRRFFEPYAPWAGLAGWHLLATVSNGGLARIAPSFGGRGGRVRSALA